MTEQVAQSTVPIEPATVTLTIPCSAEYVSVARLAILGIASRMPFSYDEVEDVRLAVGEACTHAVERAKARAEARQLAELTGTAKIKEPAPVISITSNVTKSSLVIEVADNIAAGNHYSESADNAEDSDIDHQGLGALLIEILVDEVDIKTEERGTTIRLVKNAPAA